MHINAWRSSGPLFLVAVSCADIGFSYLLTQHKTIDSVLERGEKLDSLVEKSSDLSAASQVMHLLRGL